MRCASLSIIKVRDCPMSTYQDMTITSYFRQTFCSPSFDPERDLPSLEGKVALITGASAGLGAETAKQLAKKGAHVFCLGRSKDKTMAVISSIISETGNTKVEFIQADLMDLVSVEAAAENFLRRQLPLHILVNNAGIMACPWAVSKQGIESQFATNHFAHVVLTNKLLHVIEASQPSRIVNLSSWAHENSAPRRGISYENGWNDESNYKSIARYGETKLANIHFTRELQDRLDAKAQKLGQTCRVYVNAVHPGFVATELSRGLSDSFSTGMPKLYNMISIKTERGALTQIYVAGSEDIELHDKRGTYFVPYCTEASPSNNGKSKDLAIRTWEWTEKVLKGHFQKTWSWAI